MTSIDPSSFARPDQAVIRQIDFIWNVDFNKKILTGSAAYHVDIVQPTNELYMDIRGLSIHKIINSEDKTQLQYKVDEQNVCGSRLNITLPSSSAKSCKLEIEYQTAPDATALQWLRPEQTAGGKHPYLFSQCQAIHARSMYPCQDTPSVKFGYTAKVRAPSDLAVLMSALQARDPVHNPDGTVEYEYKQLTPPIPSYLVAIAVGALVSKKVGPRSNVWAEKEFIDACAFEFVDTEKFLHTAEELCGKYQWVKYDLLILPPSFPFGGMENPCLTFATPTLLAGDRSLVNVIAHEISHSWTGNLVTNKNFEHFWLNEGFTMFVERKIDGRLYGEKFRQFSALGGLKELEEEIQTLGEQSNFTALVPNLKGVDPDDAFSVVPYEKGHTFLYYLETLLGGPEKFEPYLRSYLQKFQLKSITTDDWKQHLFEYFSDQVEVLNKVDWDTWLYKPGMPPVIPDYDKTLELVCVALSEKWIDWDEKTPNPFSTQDLNDMSADQKREFLAISHANKATLSIEKLKTMQSLYNFDAVKNCEIRYMWLRLCLKSRWEDKVNDALTFATDLGRMKYVRPIFRDLYAWEAMRQRAIDKYMEKKSSMMYVTAHMVAKDLHLIDI